jgi:hypothetical protein
MKVPDWSPEKASLAVGDSLKNSIGTGSRIRFPLVLLLQETPGDKKINFKQLLN